MGAVETQRTVVKSVPELWAELSEVALLAPMLGHFGQIRITRLQPEASIEWESELACGSVELEPSGFGTRVRLTAQLAAGAAGSESAAAPKRTGLLARLLRRAPKPAEQPLTATPPAAPAALDPGLSQGALSAVLDVIGAARHRPFSRDVGAPTPIT